MNWLNIHTDILRSSEFLGAEPLEKGIKKFLQVSSVSAFGRYDIKHPINEETKWIEHDENTNYAIAKNRSELEVWRGQEEGLNMVIVNPATILGALFWTNSVLSECVFGVCC